jgi:hypothetical protein
MRPWVERKIIAVLPRWHWLAIDRSRHVADRFAFRI